MSLRTKLLAVVIGLPGATLLVALFLFVNREAGTPLTAIDRLVHLVNDGTPDAIGPGILQQVQAGHFEAVYVVRDAGSDRELHPAQAWTAEAFYASERGQPDVGDAALQEELLGHLRRAQGQSPPFVLRTGFVAVGARHQKGERPHGIVALLQRPRAAAGVVYWVMVLGLSAMMVLSYWMISRLVIRPLARLSAAADRIADGDYRVELDGEEAGDEVGRTVRALNRMAREIAEYQGHLEDRVLSTLGRIKRAEQHLAIAQRLAATGKLASGLAHEINNPLGGMKNAVRALARGDLSPERTTLYLDLIADGLGRVEQTVKKFLSFTPRRIEPQAVDLADVAEKGIALALHRLDQKRVQVETSFPAPGQATVFGDAHELQQVALNLLLNAADAIEREGEGRVEVRVTCEGDEVVLAVSDNGMGMSPEDQDRCFDIFFTTKPVGEGSGMGLAVVHNIVTNHGGRIELSSTPGAGTTFHVYLPAEPRAQAAAQARVAAARPGAQAGA